MRGEMMPLPFMIALFAGSVCPGIIGLILSARRVRIPVRQWLTFTLIVLPVSLLSARLFYFTAQFRFVWPRYGMRFFWESGMETFAASGAIIGVLLSAFLSGGRRKETASYLLDTAAPYGALVIALFRLSEYFTGFGEGPYIESEAFHFFPFAVMNEYGEWYAAVFMLETLFALTICVTVLLRRGTRAGDSFRLTLALYGLTQIFCESLRAECIKWGFVRVQQVFAAAMCFTVFIYYVFNRRHPKEPAHVPVLKVSAFLACIGLCAAVEYALDKTEIHPLISYTVMGASILVMGILILFEMKKFPRKEGAL